MKNQSINSANAKADFVDLNAKNPFYQPLAGKVASAENKADVTGEVKKADVAPAPPKTEESKLTEHAPKLVGAVVLPEQKAEKTEPKTEKPALNLEGTLKLVEELHRRMVQRADWFTPSITLINSSSNRERKPRTLPQIITRAVNLKSLTISATSFQQKALLSSKP